MTDLLTVTMFLPTLGAAALIFVPGRFARLISASGATVAAAAFAASVIMFHRFSPHEGFQFVTKLPWIERYGIAYAVGVDGISLVLVVMTALLCAVSMLVPFPGPSVRRKEYVVSFLLLETALLGTFASMDLFLFFVFFESALIPMCLIIGAFGGSRRVYAATKFFLFTAAGSVIMLLAIIALCSAHLEQFGTPTTDIADLLAVSLSSGQQGLLFLAFVIAFAVKIPIIPFHTWLPDAHVEAPTAGSVLLAGVFLKIGGYGLLRLAFPLFPDAAAASAPYLGALGAAGILYGGVLALAQQDMKRLVAYSSVSHMGFVVLGLASLSVPGMGGAVFAMVSHGLTTGMLFLLVGMLYERRKTRMLEDFGGLAGVTPRLALVFLIVTLGAVGLPGLSGFVGEFLVLSGSFGASVLGRPVWMAVAAVAGVVLSAVYMLILIERVFFGPVSYPENRFLPDLLWREAAAVLIPVILIVALGLRPGTVLSRIEPSLLDLVHSVRTDARITDIKGLPR